jgi:tetratricopeptide (TPR) repeat protein
MEQELGRGASATVYLARDQGSLRDRLPRTGPLGLAAVRQLGTDLASALGYAHALGIVHRDLKTENIMLSLSGHAILADFGIAYSTESRSGDVGGGGRLTETGVTLGTPAYMSPEQAAGDEVVDGQTDQYALAAVLYEALTGTPPFTGANARAILARKLTVAPPPLRDRRPDISPAAEQVILRALDRQPAARFETMEAFTQAFAAAAAAPFDVPAQGAQGDTVDSRPRRRRLVLALVLGLGLVAAAAVGLTRGWGRGPTPLAEAQVYEAELTEVFGVQSAIAEQVTQALDLALGAPARAALAQGGTRQPEAYDFYLRGNDYLGRSNAEADLRSAARLYQQAVALDSGFAQAQARLGRAHAAMYWFYHDHTPARLESAKRSVDAALRLAPELPETRMALGYNFYWGRRDYRRALQEFELALREQPSNSELLQAIGYVQRRTGNWDQAIARFAEALRYDPRSQVRTLDLADSYFSTRQYEKAERLLDRAIQLAPDCADPYASKAMLQLVRDGDRAGPAP